MFPFNWTKVVSCIAIIINTSNILNMMRDSGIIVSFWMSSHIEYMDVPEYWFSVYIELDITAAHGPVC